MCAATVVALVANEVGAALFGKRAAAFVAALTIGMAGGLVGSRLRRSPLVFIVPGVLMLVPGARATTACCSWSPTRRSAASRLDSTRS